MDLCKSDAIPEPRVVPPLFRLAVKKANAITPLNSCGFSPSFYCVHPIAGDVTSFYALARRLDKTVSLYGIQVPREMMNPSFGSSVEDMARHYVSAIAAFQPYGALLLGGWSAGAIIALEMAQQLQRSGRTVSLLIALDGAPCNTDTAMSKLHPMFALKIFANLPFWVAEEVRQAASLANFVGNLATKMRFRFRRAFPAIRNNQTLDGDVVQALLVTRSWSDSQMAFIRSLYRALQAYKPEIYEGPVLVFESRIQPLLSLRQVGSAWRRLCPLARVVVLKSNHMGIFREPTLHVLVQSLLDHLAHSNV